MLYIIIIVEFVIIVLSLRRISELLKRLKRHDYNYIYFKMPDSTNANVSKNVAKYHYDKKPFMSACEKKFYEMLKCFEKDYIVVPQVNLGSVIDKKSAIYRNELFRNIDFGIFSKDSDCRLLLLIELNDSSHYLRNRVKRDQRVKNICKSANIPLITFYTNMPNEPNYVIPRIQKELRKEE